MAPVLQQHRRRGHCDSSPKAGSVNYTFNAHTSTRTMAMLVPPMSPFCALASDPCKVCLVSLRDNHNNIERLQTLGTRTSPVRA